MGKYGYTSNMGTSEKTMIAIVRIAESFKKNGTKIFQNYGLTFAQYTVLRVLEGSDSGQNTMGNVSNIMLVSGANTTPIAKRLEKKGYIIRTLDSEDDRRKILKITNKGLQLLKYIEDEKNDLNEKYLSGYTNAMKNELLRSMREILYKIS